MINPLAHEDYALLNDEETAHILDSLCVLLHDYLGPAAKIICDDITRDGARLCSISDLKAIIYDMALEIRHRNESEEFARRAMELISNR